MISYEDELYHHGIKGQKWGVRRYRNPDGTLTEAGKQRYGGSDSKKSSGLGKKIAVGAAIGVGVGLTAYALANPTSRKALAKFAKSGAAAVASVGNKTGSVIAKGWENAKPKIKQAAVNRAKGLGTAIDKASEAALSASMAVLGGVVVTKVAQKYDTSGDENDPRTIRNKMIVESTKAATNTFVKTATTSTVSNNQNKKGGNVGKEVSDRLGPPNHKPVDKQSPEWTALFKDSSGNNRPDDVRATIKALSRDYGIDQIKEYLDMVDRGTIRHSDLSRANRYIRHQCYELELYHHGIKGQKWGVRRYVRKDGTLTPLGQERMQVASQDAKLLSNMHARVEDAHRIVARNLKDTPEGTKLLVDSDTKRAVDALIQRTDALQRKMSKKYKSVDSMPITRAGKDYIYTLLVDKKTGFGAEYITELHEKSRR